MLGNLHDIEYSMRLRAAWHEAGHVIIAMMNYPASVERVVLYPYKRDQIRTGCAGYTQLGLIGSHNTAGLMPAEYFVAGCVAESMLTGIHFDELWTFYECTHDVDTGDTWALREYHPDIDDFEHTSERVAKLLTLHKKQLRLVAKRLMRKGELPGWYGSWLHSVGEGLTKMSNPAMDTALAEYDAQVSDAKRRYAESVGK